ncbi:MAG: hypothetical protein O2887_18095 [Bacteroidetes bacterium]|nr:hypothetical protein [Bacteroidota bacterium]MDA1122368.1 hypothetical protein [Bacteroidota bacterium]
MYRGRADCENRIKEIKRILGLITSTCRTLQPLKQL